MLRRVNRYTTDVSVRVGIVHIDSALQPEDQWNQLHYGKSPKSRIFKPARQRIWEKMEHQATNSSEFHGRIV